MSLSRNIEVAGVVLLVTYTDEDGKLATPGHEFVMSDFANQGYDVRNVFGAGGGAAPYGGYRVEVAAPYGGRAYGDRVEVRA